ncbi:MAG: AAA family ATPase [Chloroflexi bacterium]|nr:AAA family ATPase [Chloroflexota bacterium]
MYTSFSIENFRLFDQLTVEPLARVNLIAGQNNAGKTALLEAIWLHSGQNTPDLAQRINIWRGLPASEPGELFSELFRDYQTDLPIQLAASHDGGSTAGVLNIVRRRIADRTTTLAPGVSAAGENRRSPSDNMSDHEVLFDYEDDSGQTFASRAWVELTSLPFDLPVPPGMQFDGNVPTVRAERGISSSDRKSSVFMQSLGRIAPPELAARFGRAEIAGYISDVEGVMRLIEPRLRRLTAVPSADGPALIYGDVGAGRIIPIALMGSGFSRLLELTLAFAEVSNGSIMVDEIENGLHHSVLTDVWQAVNRLSHTFNVQVFATTHSYECIVAANAAFSELGSNHLHLHRLYRRSPSESVKAITYTKEALDTNIEYLWELR